MQTVTHDNLPSVVGQIYELLSEISERLNTPAQPQKADKDYLTIQETATLINRSVQTIYGMTHRKEIPHFRRGKMLAFKRGEIEAWIEETRRETNDETRRKTLLTAANAMKGVRNAGAATK